MNPEEMNTEQLADALEKLNELTAQIDDLKRQIFERMKECVMPSVTREIPLMHDREFMAWKQQVISVLRRQSHQKTHTDVRPEFSEAVIHWITQICGEIHRAKMYNVNPDKLRTNPTELVLLGVFLRHPGILMTLEQLSNLTGYALNSIRTIVSDLQEDMQNTDSYHLNGDQELGWTLSRVTVTPTQRVLYSEP